MTNSPATRPGSLDPFTSSSDEHCNDNGTQKFPAEIKEANAALSEFGGVSSARDYSSIIEEGATAIPSDADRG